MSEKYPCPHGRYSGQLVLCSAPCDKTGASKEWQNYEKDGIILTPSFCAHSCPLDVPKPVLERR